MKFELTGIYKSNGELLDSDAGIDEPFDIVITMCVHLHMRLAPQRISPESGQVFRAQACSDGETQGRRRGQVFTHEGAGGRTQVRGTLGGSGPVYSATGPCPVWVGGRRRGSALGRDRGCSALSAVLQREALRRRPGQRGGARADGAAGGQPTGSEAGPGRWVGRAAPVVRGAVGQVLPRVRCNVLWLYM